MAGPTHSQIGCVTTPLGIAGVEFWKSEFFPRLVAVVQTRYVGSLASKRSDNVTSANFGLATPGSYIGKRSLWSNERANVIT